jgi:uncharacterized XkdX family phage protein
MFDALKKRYLAGFMTAAQLERFFDLGKITREEYDQILSANETVGTLQ